MTIDELLAAAGLTANDEIPIWDAEATGEATKKITAQSLAAAVVALANLVTGVKGDAESSYRHGNVNITPANIGAMATSAVMDIPHGGTDATTAARAVQNLFDVGANDANYSYPTEPGIYRISADIFNNMNPYSSYGVLVIFQAQYGLHLYMDSYGRIYHGFSGEILQEPTTWYVTNVSPAPQ